MSDQSKQAESTDPRVQAALREYLERIDRGEVVNHDEFLSRHSEIADALRSFFAGEEPLREMAVTRISPENAATSTQSIAAQGQETVLPKLQPGGALGTPGSGLTGTFGRYAIIRALGKGAMGAVYLAQDTQLKRPVAIKTPRLEEDPTGELLQRFYREAEAAATLRHANICPVFDVGQIDGKHFISMAYIEGRPLADLIKSGKLPNERHILIAVYKLTRALQQAHDHGIVHRDLKPANIMIDKQGQPIIMDFGLARKRRAEGEASLTHSGVILGSPAYMSPEQIEGDPESVGPASDQYTLGVVLYEMLTGQLPFRGSVINVLALIMTKDPTAPSELRPGLDPRIEAVCLQMMSKKASERFPSMRAVADQLAAIVKNPAAVPVPGPIADEKSPTSSPPPAGPRLSSADAAASQIGQSLDQRAISPDDATSIEELVRKCLGRRDYDQMIQIIERIPEDQRSATLQTLLEQARQKVDEIAFLICEIDEADRLADRQTALTKAEELLKTKPGHHRAQQIQEKYADNAKGAAARIGPLQQFTRPWKEGGWIPWSVLAFGLAVLAGLYGVIVVSLGNKTAIVIDAKDPGITVEVNDRHVTIKAPGEQSIQVEPGDQAVKISYAGLQAVTKSFTLEKDKTQRLTVWVLDNKLLADLNGESLPAIGGTGNKNIGTAPAEPKGHAQIPLAAAPPLAPANPPRRNDGFVPLFNGQDPTQGGSAPPGTSLDSDRKAAEAILGLGGSVEVRVAAQERSIPPGGGLPVQPFELIRIRLDRTANLTDASLEPLESTSHLVAAEVLHCRSVGDAGLAHLRNQVQLQKLVFEGTGVTDAGLAIVERLPHLDLLGLGSTSITDAALAHVEHLTNLHALWLGQGPRITDAGLAHLQNLTALRALNLWDAPIDGPGLQHLESLKELERLALGGTHVDDQGLAHLSGLRQLRQLFLGKTRVTNDGLANLEPLTALHDLSLESTGVSNSGLAHLKALTELRTLNLRKTRVTDGGLEYLAGLSKLSNLNLHGDRITDAGLEMLKDLSGLAELNVTRTRVTASGVARLQKSLPHCRIIANPKIR